MHFGVWLIALLVVVIIILFIYFSIGRISREKTLTQDEAKMKFESGKMKGRNMYHIYGVMEGKKLYWAQSGEGCSKFNKEGDVRGAYSFFSREDAEEFIKESVFPDDLQIEERFYDSSYFK